MVFRVRNWSQVATARYESADVRPWSGFIPFRGEMGHPNPSTEPRHEAVVGGKTPATHDLSVQVSDGPESGLSGS